MGLDKWSSLIDRLDRERWSVERALAEERENLGSIIEREKDLLEAQRVVQSLVQSVQQKVFRRISEIVSKCLLLIFDNPYEFRIDFVRQRGRAEAKLVFCRDGLVLDDPLAEVGGGVIDIASFALRLACILLSVPKRRRFLVLDEPWKNVRGEGNRNRTRAMLLELSRELGFQFLINTDIPNYRLGNVVFLGEGD